jgi:hypothetical protein
LKGKCITTAIFPVILTGLFLSMAEAQLCGTFGLKITVTDQSGNAVEGATVRIEPDVITKTRKLLQDAKDRKVFQVIIQEGDQPGGGYELQVGAPGFETFRQEVSFPHCKRQALEVRLRRLPDERLKGATALPLQAAPLVIGETFTLDSGILGETRRINVMRSLARCGCRCFTCRMVVWTRISRT